MNPRIRGADSRFASDMRETRLEVGWPRLHVWKMSHYHTWKGEETRTDTELGYLVGPVRGIALSGSLQTGCYPDTDEEGWPE